jgi:ribonuclease HII
MSVVLIDANGVEFRQTLTLTTEMANYTYTFTYDGTATSGKLDFEFGNISAASVPAVITMDNITVSGSEVVNGTFDQVLAWGSWAQNWDPMGNVALTIVDGQLVADVTALGGAFWGVQLFQEGFELVPGATYTIMFDLMASVERDFNVVLIDGNGAEFRKAYNATTGMETYMYTFVYDGSSEVGKLDFEFGNISAASVPAVFTMDNIMLFRDFSNAAEVDPGTGEEPTTDWVAWGALTATAVENGTEFTYTDTPTEWWNNNAQLAVESFDGTKDAILFTFTGVLDQTYLFKIEGGGVSQEISVTATGVSQVVELPLIALSETERAGLNLIIFFATTVGGSGTALVEGWEYPAAPAPAYIGYGMDVVIGDPDVTITYTDITVGAWWTKNVQGVIDSFDGTQTSVVFNFTGEDTQTYLFKVEGNGVSREISAVADGTSQSITLDLSDLTETERAGLVLLVIFCQTEGASGTLVFHGWEYPTA